MNETASTALGDHTCQSVFNTCHYMLLPSSMPCVGAGVVPVDWLFSQYFYVCDTLLCRISYQLLLAHHWCLPVLVLAPAPACFSACLCSRQELFLLCGCCDPVEGGQDSRRVSQLKGEACLAPLGLTCSVGMPCIRSCGCWGGEAGSGRMKYAELCYHRKPL